MKFVNDPRLTALSRGCLFALQNDGPRQAVISGYASMSGYRGVMNIIPQAEVVFSGLVDAVKTGGADIPVEKSRLMSLIDLYVSSWDFDEKYYLSTYPDVAKAVEDGVIDSAWEHFRRHGYLEGRLPINPAVDEDWYLTTYPDVASAVLKGAVDGARTHYEKFGRAEGRLPRKPSISSEWYARRYLPSNADKAGPRACEEHFIKAGYAAGALPHRPK